MNRLFLIITMLLGFVTSVSAQSDYYLKKAQNYQREAEYYQKKADSYRQNVAYYLKKVEEYQRDAAYYTKRGELDRAKTYFRYAENERWINTRPNFVMQHKLTIKPQHSFVGPLTH